MLATMTITEVLALFIGLYCVAAGIGLATDWKGFKTLLDELNDHCLAGFLTGVFTFTLGALIITLHNDWSNVLGFIVSLMGWGVLIEGLLILAFRRKFVSFFSGFPMTAKTMIPYGGFAIFLGPYLRRHWLELVSL